MEMKPEFEAEEEDLCEGRIVEGDSRWLWLVPDEQVSVSRASFGGYSA